jgi:hypothetical protein
MNDPTRRLLANVAAVWARGSRHDGEMVATWDDLTAAPSAALDNHW